MHSTPELLIYIYKLAAPKYFFFASSCRAKNDPPARKSGYGLLLGCRSPLDAGPFEKTLFFDDVRQMNWPTTGKLFTVCFGPASQSVERGRFSREGALDVRESRERRDKIVPVFSP